MWPAIYRRDFLWWCISVVGWEAQRGQRGHSTGDMPYRSAPPVISSRLIAGIRGRPGRWRRPRLKLCAGGAVSPGGHVVSRHGHAPTDLDLGAGVRRWSRAEPGRAATANELTRWLPPGGRTNMPPRQFRRVDRCHRIGKTWVMGSAASAV